MAQKHKFGRQGESLAASFLTGQGYQILERNFRWNGIEIDLIAQNDEYIVFVEVKTRHNRLESPEQFLPQRKKQRMTRLADFYVNDKAIGLEVRFDLVIIDWQKDNPVITHIQNAFLPGW